MPNRCVSIATPELHHSFAFLSLQGIHVLRHHFSKAARKITYEFNAFRESLFDCVSLVSLWRQLLTIFSLGRISSRDKSKSVERRRRKATGLMGFPTIAGLPECNASMFFIPSLEL